MKRQKLLQIAVAMVWSPAVLAAPQKHDMDCVAPCETVFMHIDNVPMHKMKNGVSAIAMSPANVTYKTYHKPRPATVAKRRTASASAVQRLMPRQTTAAPPAAIVVRGAEAELNPIQVTPQKSMPDFASAISEVVITAEATISTALAPSPMSSEVPAATAAVLPAPHEAGDAAVASVSPPAALPPLPLSIGVQEATAAILPAPEVAATDVASLSVPATQLDIDLLTPIIVSPRLTLAEQPVVALPQGVQVASALSDEALGDIRAGFMVNGIEFNIGATMKSFVDGSLVYETVLSTSDSGVDTLHTVGIGTQALSNAAAGGIQLGALPGTGVYVPGTNGGTAIIHDTTGGIANILLNTADGRNLVQDTNVTIGISNLPQLQQAGTIGALTSALQDQLSTILVNAN